MFTIARYTEACKALWDEFVDGSKNGTFLFRRDYMDYHADRFDDFSLLIARQDSTVFALLPANRVGDTLFSHQGLTYGGLLTNAAASAESVMEAFRAINDYLRKEGIRRVVYKPTPYIYHTLPADEDLYALFAVCNATLVAREISTTIPRDNRPKWSHGRRYGINRCKTNAVEIGPSDDYEAFWRVLEDNLMERHGVKPVHKLNEMLMLKSRFPENIRLYTARKDCETLGGTVLYITKNVVHTQYISASPVGKKLLVLDAIFNQILNHDYTDAPFFDFGKSTEQAGKLLNASLISQKEGFGGRAVCYDTYEWTIH